MILKNLLAVSLLIFVVFLITPSVAQTPINLVPPGCGWVPNEKGPGRHTLVCNGGTLRGFQDWEGGRYVPGHANSLNVNISGGSSKHRGYVVLSPDNGKGTIMQDGRLHKLLLVRGNHDGGTEFRIRPRFLRSLVICDKAGEGCIDLYRVVKRLDVASSSP